MSFFRELLSEYYGVVVIRTTASASATNRPASAGSAFSQAFAEGIGGKAEEDANGTVHFSELSRYLNGRVRELSGGKQATAISVPAVCRHSPSHNQSSRWSNGPSIAVWQPTRQANRCHYQS